MDLVERPYAMLAELASLVLACAYWFWLANAESSFAFLFR
jgi:hypothetical protein